MYGRIMGVWRMLFIGGSWRCAAEISMPVRGGDGIRAVKASADLAAAFGDIGLGVPGAQGCDAQAFDQCFQGQ